MDIKYNAFISYRHHPDDIRVATEIHRGLERFKVPKAIRKRSAGITRLFRDKDELPITSSLTDDITRALKNSDYLIVICSVHTKESVWVQREIETFLSTHDRSKVLTVLVNGEPYDVIPEILLHEDVVDPISGEIHRTEIEPLSCDWRVKRSKAMREELPRLAAALLGCGYDELRQRQRQYKTRRLVALFSAALTASLCLAAYFLHTSIQIQKANDELNLANEEIRTANLEISAANEEIQQANVQIQNNLDDALRNQSRYLATRSQEYLKNGDRLTAISLALAALPDENNQRPYVPAAELALSNALSSYVSEPQVSAEGAFDVGARVDSFSVTADGKTIYITDSRDTITVWDTHSFQKLASIDTGSYSLNKSFTTPGGNLLLCTGAADGRLLCYGPDGALIWQAENCADCAFLNDRSILMVLNRNYPDMYITYLDPETGAQLRPALKLNMPDDSTYVSAFCQLDNSDNCPMALKGYCGTEHYVFLPDRSTGQLSKLIMLDLSGDNMYRNIECVSADSSGRVYAIISTGNGIYNGNYGTFEVTSPATSEIFCYDASDGRMVWRSEITTYTYSTVASITPVPNTDLIMCQSNNVFQLHDAATGRIVSACDTLSVPVSVTVEQTSTWGILANGSYFLYNHESDLCFSYPFMDGTVSMAQIQNAYFVLPPLSTQVTAYRSVKDENAKPLAEGYELAVEKHLQHGSQLAIVYYKTLYLFDAQENTLKLQHSFDNYIDPLAFSEDGSTLWLWDSTADSVIVIDTASGAISTTQIPHQLGTDYTYFDSPVFVSGTRLLYILESYGRVELFCYDLSGNTFDSWALPTAGDGSTLDYAKSGRILALTANNIWFWRDGSGVSRLEISGGAVHPVLPDAASVLTALANDSGTQIALAAENRLLLISEDGNVSMQIFMEGRKGVSLCFYGDELLALCDDGVIYRYDSNGTLLSQTVLSIYSTFSAKADSVSDPMGFFWHFTGDGDLIVGALGAGNIIDCGEWQCRAFVPHITAYIPVTDQLVCLSGRTLVLFPRYTTAQQTDRALAALNGFSLSAEQKQGYGIE